jgi:hypothetical protein
MEPLQINNTEIRVDSMDGQTVPSYNARWENRKDFDFEHSKLTWGQVFKNAGWTESGSTKYKDYDALFLVFDNDISIFGYGITPPNFTIGKYYSGKYRKGYTWLSTYTDNNGFTRCFSTRYWQPPLIEITEDKVQ